jgi:hypothetical protein
MPRRGRACPASQAKPPAPPKRVSSSQLLCSQQLSLQQLSSQQTCSQRPILQQLSRQQLSRQQLNLQQPSPQQLSLQQLSLQQLRLQQLSQQRLSRQQLNLQQPCPQQLRLQQLRLQQLSQQRLGRQQLNLQQPSLQHLSLQHLSLQQLSQQQPSPQQLCFPMLHLPRRGERFRLPRSLAGSVLWALPILALVCCLAGCHSSPPKALDADAASCIPAGTLVLAGVDLDRLRPTPLYSRLPAAALAIIGSLNSASSALLAYNGKELLVVAQGRFTQPPPGATLAGPNLAVFGSPDSVTAAMAQHRTGVSGAPTLAALAEPIAAGHQIWIVVQGGTPLPLTGNAENLNHVIRNADSVTLTAHVDSGLGLTVTALGRTATTAQTIEESLRAEITLAAAAESHQPDLAKLLQSIQIDRDSRTVRITLSTDAAAAAKLLELVR